MRVCQGLESRSHRNSEVKVNRGCKGRKYMTPEALDFEAECEQIHALLKQQNTSIFKRRTQFKNWTVGEIIGHLHLWNIAANLSLTDPDGFSDFITNAMQQLSAGDSHAAFQATYFEGQSDAKIFEAWAAYYSLMAHRFHTADPDRRVKWAGPDMSVRACIIARQMEHWAHAQAIFDLMGIERINADRVKNVVHIGVTTFSWSFRVRGKTPPSPKPYIKLIAPSGEIWTWNDEQTDNRIEGLAAEFSQVVTQCRHLEDTSLITTGEIAAEWMAHAQCFAGGPETPPSPGTRFKAAKVLID